MKFGLPVLASVPVLLFSSLLSFSALAAGSMVADVTLNPMGDFKAKSDEVVGEAIQDGDTVKAESITVKLGKLDCGLPVRTRHAKEKYLEVEKYPEAVLSKASGKGGNGKGTLSFHGVSKEVTGTYKVEGGNLKADFPIKLSEFNIKNINYMSVGVEDEVKIHITVPVKVAASAPAPAKK